MRMSTPTSPLSPYTSLFRSLEARLHSLVRVLEKEEESVAIEMLEGRMKRALGDFSQEDTNLIQQWMLERYMIRELARTIDRKSTRLNSSHLVISYAVFCL